MKNLIKTVLGIFIKSKIEQRKQEKIVEKFSSKKEEQELLKKIIFKSDEWFMFDEGLLNYEEAIKIFKEKLPSNLKLKVDNIM